MTKISNQTIREFEFKEDVFAIVDAWARENRFKKKGGDANRRLFQKGYGFWVAPMMAEISQAGANVRLIAWVRVPTLNRILTFFLLPSSMGIESGGLKLAAPRKIARTAVNRLLEKLGQPPI